MWCTFACIGSIISQILPPCSIHHSFFFSRINIFFFNIFTILFHSQLLLKLKTSTTDSFTTRYFSWVFHPLIFHTNWSLDSLASFLIWQLHLKSLNWKMSRELCVCKRWGRASSQIYRRHIWQKTGLQTEGMYLECVNSSADLISEINWLKARKLRFKVTTEPFWLKNLIRSFHSAKLSCTNLFLLTLITHSQSL